MTIGAMIVLPSLADMLAGTTGGATAEEEAEEEEGVAVFPSAGEQVQRISIAKIKKTGKSRMLVA